MNFNILRKRRLLAILFLIPAFFSFGTRESVDKKELPATGSFIEIRVYHFTTMQQLMSVDSFLKQAFLPALHEAGLGQVGVFKPVGVDTAADKKMYVLIPYKSLKQFQELPGALQKSKLYTENGSPYLRAAFNQAPYTRFETILLQAFKEMPFVKTPELGGLKNEHLYELRSYESSTEQLHQNKVEMFNKGGEVSLFQRLGFNAVFYGQVLSGSRMPNLMYMTSFENKAARDEHWKQFSSDPFWKTLSAKPEYQNNVSKIDIVFLNATDYSDL